MIKILFICHGNICRSPMAEFYMKYLVNQAGLDDEFYIASAATSREEIGNDIHRGTKSKLKEMGIPFSKRQAYQVTKKDYDYFDYLVVMDDNNLRNLRYIIGEDNQHKIFKAMSFIGNSRDVKDPWYTGDFQSTYEDISESCQALLDKIIKEHEVNGL